MRAILIIVLMILTVSAHSQQKINKVDSLQFAVNHISLNLKKSHSCFTTGLCFMGSGLLFTAIGVQSENPKPGIIMGGIMSTIGSIFLIRAHTFIGRAGNIPYENAKFKEYYNNL